MTDNLMRSHNSRRLCPHLLGPAILLGLITVGGSANADGRPASAKHAVRAVGGASIGSALAITGSDQNHTYHGTHSSIVVSGSQNTLTLKGNWEAIEINGSSNHLHIIGTVANVKMMGSDNVVTWTRRKYRGTSISSTGSNNSAARKP